MKDKKDTKQLLWQSDLGDGTFRNPVLYADYSDPDVIRVGDTFYMTASSFNYMPGLPILTSQDLVNWKLVNYAVKNLPYAVYDRPAHAKGIWAPAIRYHAGKFWICFGMPDEGIFMTSTENPLGEWSPLTCVWEGKGFIDSCPFWDKDGRAYVIHGYAKSRIGFNSKLGMFEIDPVSAKCISEDQFIFDGTVTQPTIEGPKVYKRDDYYYIFAPAGGVKQGWQTVLRSKNIAGPYEEKIVMHQGNTMINGPHQGGLVDTVKGEEWFLHFQQKGVYGRIVHIQPVSWADGWPMIGMDRNQDGIGEPVESYRKPDGILSEEICGLETDDDFEADTLGLQWQWLANGKESFYSLKERKGSLCLYPINTTGDHKPLLWNSANVLTQKIICPEFTAETQMDTSLLPVGAKSGVILIGAQYAALSVERNSTGLKINYIESEGDDGTKIEKLIKEFPCNEISQIKFRINFYQDGIGDFQFAHEGGDWSLPTPRFSPQGAVWVGAKVGMFAISAQDTQPEGKVFFDYFTVDSGK